MDQLITIASQVPSAKFFVFFSFFVSFNLAIAFEASYETEENVTVKFPKKWMTELFREAEINFHITSIVSSKCPQDFATNREHLKNQSEWAVKSE